MFGVCSSKMQRNSLQLSINELRSRSLPLRRCLDVSHSRKVSSHRERALFQNIATGSAIYIFLTLARYDCVPFFSHFVHHVKLFLSHKMRWHRFFLIIVLDIFSSYTFVSSLSTEFCKAQVSRARIHFLFQCSKIDENHKSFHRTTTNRISINTVTEM